MIERILIFLIFFSVFFFPDRNLDPLFVILFSLSGILLIKKILKRSEGFKINFNYLSIPFLSFPILIFVATFFSSYKYASFLRLGEIILIYFVFLLFNIFSEEEKKFTENILILLSVLHSIYSIIKYFILHQQRAGGNFLNPNHSAFILLGGLFLVLGRYYKDKNKLLLFITLPLFLSIILSRSRSSILAIILMLPLFFFGKKKLKLTLFSISFLLLILLIFSLVPNPLSQYILRTYDPFSFRRIEIWRAGLRIFLDNWIYGVGPSNFYYRVEPYRFPEERRAARFAITFGNAHNDYIQLLSEMGLLAIPFLAGILFLSINILKNILIS
ncbi:MAG: O-antigen ligase family protein, partial [Candidatus Aminicenantia bacterium]